MENQDNRNKGITPNATSIKNTSKNSKRTSQQIEGCSSARWDNFLSLKFIELCDEEILLGNRPNSHFNASGWKNLVRKFNELTGRNYVYKQLRNHWDSMKKDWILFKKLMQMETGIGWNPRSNSLDAFDEWWERKIKENGDYVKFKNKDLSLVWFLHSSCRNCVESTFGVWKARWNILADMPYYHIDIQREIVLATMAIYNYIRKKNISDEAFQMAEYESYQPCTERNISTSNSTTENEDNPGNVYWMAVRDSIAMEIARSG